MRCKRREMKKILINRTQNNNNTKPIILVTAAHGGDSAQRPQVKRNPCLGQKSCEK